MTKLSAEEVRTLRLHAQGLQPQYPLTKLVEVVSAVVGIQAQLAPAMQLALRARVKGLTLKYVNDAIGESRSLVRSWTMRGTLHLLPSEDLNWINALLSPTFIPKGKGRRAQLGLDQATAAKGLKAIREILSDGKPLNRGEIVERLVEHGIQLERRSQAPIHLIGLAALEGMICLAMDTPKGESTYTLAEKWIKPGEALPRDKALAELARRYLKGYAPASMKDFAGWSGLTLTDAKRAWEALKGELVEAEVDGKALWMVEGTKKLGKPKLNVRLLPAFDAYLLGYADRELLVAKKHQSEVYHGGQTVPVVLVDGLAAGTWRYKRQGKRLEITVHPFAEFDDDVRDLIAEEADDIGRFWDVKASLAYSEKSV